MGLLDSLIRTRLQLNGEDPPTDRGTVNLIADGGSLSDNPSEDRTDLTLTVGTNIGIVIAVSRGIVTP